MADEREMRKRKRAEILSAGKLPYKGKYERSHSLTEAKALPLGTEGVRIAGRLLLLRPMGKLIFGTLQDMTGRMQILLRKDRMPEEAFQIFRSLVDVGDFLGCAGEVMETKTGERTLDCDGAVLLSKTLRPLPEKFHGLADKEMRYRRRYLDLVSNPEAMERFLLRSRILESFRRFFIERGYVEVETPILQSKASGALARPFVTWHNTLGVELALRIAPETYLKRLVMGGMDKVFEMAKCFRNEGMDSAHLQEFTLLEFYQAYSDMEDLIELVQKMLPRVIREALGATAFRWQDDEVDLAPPWPRTNMRDLLLREANVDIEEAEDLQQFMSLASQAGHQLDAASCPSKAAAIDHLYKRAVRPLLRGPLFITGHPVELSPLARKNEDRPWMADRFQVVVAGEEIVNAYSELADPVEQLERFEEQALARQAGDEEAHVMDEEYVDALEHGMPPTAGCGIGIDRFVALVTGQENLRDVIFFPLMRQAGDVPQEMADETPCSAKGLPSGEIPFDREEALAMLEERGPDDWLRFHSLATESILRALAEELSADPELWGLAGLLHDLDFRETEGDMTRHGQVTAELLRERGAPENMLRAILAHNGENVGVQPTSALDYALSAAEQITGLIVAASKVLPDKKIASLKAKSVKKRMKEKAFARRVDREKIKDCDKAGLDLDRFIEISLAAMMELEASL